MGNSGGGIFTFIFIFIILGAIFVFFGDLIPKVDTFHKSLFDIPPRHKIFKLSSEKQITHDVVNPSADVENWCKIQKMQVSDDQEFPVEDNIIGWDLLDNCCVREIKGYNCAIGMDSILRYCYTADIGGEIKYVTIDGYYVNDVNLYKQFIDDYDKYIIANKPCDINKYPVILQALKI